MTKFILASSSPRRQDILKSLNIPFTVQSSSAPEDYPSSMNLFDVPSYLAQKKVEDVKSHLCGTEDMIILGADTVIIYNNRIYGKPKDRNDAFDTINSLQGQTHNVVTGLCLFNGKTDTFTTRTSINEVTFAELNESEINSYLDTDEWKGVAGGYRIQSKASMFISSIKGTESSIIGLPIFELCDILKEQNFYNFAGFCTDC